SIECGNPVGDQVRVVARTEKLLRAFKQPVMVLMPTHAVAALEGPQKVLHVVGHRNCGQEKSWQVSRTVVLRQREGLLGRKPVAVAGGVVIDVSARRLGVQ